MDSRRETQERVVVSFDLKNVPTSPTVLVLRLQPCHCSDRDLDSVAVKGVEGN